MEFTGIFKHKKSLFIILNFSKQHWEKNEV